MENKKNNKELKEKVNLDEEKEILENDHNNEEVLVENDNDQLNKTKVKDKKEAKALKIKELKNLHQKEIAAKDEEIILLKDKITTLELEKLQDIAAFKIKAQSFASKAQEEIARHKKEIAKQNETELNTIKKYSSQQLLEAIMEPILNIEIAVQSGKKDPSVQAYVIGFEMLLNQFYSELEIFGVSKIEPQIDQPFNPELHYAISTIEGEPEKAHKIIEVKKIGFMLHDRVLKPATVVIGK